MIDSSCKDIILDNILTPILLINKANTITYVNNLFEVLSGYKKDELFGLKLSEKLIESSNNEILYNITKKETFAIECTLKHKLGLKIPVTIVANSISSSNKKNCGTLIIFKDNFLKLITTTKINNLKQLALFDPLTEIPNRRLFELELNKCFSKLNRFPEFSFGILFIDIDDFKKINDNYGHPTGDSILIKVARKIKSSLRPYDIISRYGGEEFLAIIQFVENKKLKEIAERIRKNINDMDFPELKENKISVSIGATIARKHDTIDSIILRADKLMYQGKKKGKNIVTSD